MEKQITTHNGYDRQETLRLKISNSKPVSIQDFGHFLVGLNNLFKIYVEKQDIKISATSPELQLISVKEGSMIFEIIASASPLIFAFCEWLLKRKEKNDPKDAQFRDFMINNNCTVNFQTINIYYN
jgi:hypothetical protein